jgi:curved DNA-binding protein CbpA
VPAIEEGQLPRLVEGVDMRSLPIGPEEAFVLTRVDGRSSEAEIAAATGLDARLVQQSLQRLVELGAVRYEGASAASSSPPPRAQPTVPPHIRISHPAIETRAPAHPDAEHPASALYDPAELDEQVDLELPRKRKILDHFYRLETASHYELLDVGEQADKKEIREAYFKIVGTFHPDKYYGKRLGSFKTKLERVFQRLTEAQEVLARNQTRAEYDAYLASQRRTRRIEQSMGSGSFELEAARREIEQEARVSERRSHAPPTSSAPPSVDPEERRRSLARKLRGSLAPPARTSVPPEQQKVSRQAIQEHVADELKRRYESRLSHARENQVKKYVEAAEGALATRDVISAANALRIAVTLAPDDQELKAKFEDAQEKATAALADTYLEQAKYEEANRHWLEAAATYEKVARGKPNAAIFDKIATCLYEGGGDLRKAGDMARKAVAAAPRSLEPRMTLAKIYVKAGMKESALAEFERAAQVEPEDDSIKDWIKRIKRGEV